MKIIKLFFALLLVSLVATGQTKVEKSIPAKTGQKLVLNFDYPELKIQTWEQNEILIKGTVSINNGENDNAFELEVMETGPEITITSIIKNKENLPRRIMIKKGDTEYFFKAKDVNDPEVQKFLEENGREYTYMSNGIIKEINLEIFVPKNLETNVQAKYGLVEVKNFNGPLTLDAKYGGADVTIPINAVGEIMARSRYGEILTNLDVKFEQTAFRHDNDWTEIYAKPGSGPKYSLESKYGKLYLRKP